MKTNCKFSDKGADLGEVGFDGMDDRAIIVPDDFGTAVC